MRALLQRLVIKIVKGNWGRVLPSIFTAAAEGTFGPQVRKVYWFLAGKKTVLGAVIVFACYGLEAICNVYPDMGWGCRWSQYLVWVGGFLFSVGLVDGGNRAPWPETPDGKAPWK